MSYFKNKAEAKAVIEGMSLINGLIGVAFIEGEIETEHLLKSLIGSSASCGVASSLTKMQFLKLCEEAFNIAQKADQQIDPRRN